MLKASEAGQMLNLSARKIYDLAASGELGSYRFGGAVRFEIRDLEEYKEKCRRPATARVGATRAAGTINLTPALADSASALSAFFQRAKGRGRSAPDFCS